MDEYQCVRDFTQRRNFDKFLNNQVCEREELYKDRDSMNDLKFTTQNT